MLGWRTVVGVVICLQMLAVAVWSSRAGLGSKNEEGSFVPPLTTSLATSLATSLGTTRTETMTSVTTATSSTLQSTIGSSNFTTESYVPTTAPAIRCPEPMELKEVPQFDLSIVMTTRVDAYGGEESFQRFQTTLDGLASFCCLVQNFKKTL